MLSLASPLSTLYGAGPVKIKALKKLGLKNCEDLIFYFPFRYNDFSKIVAIGDLTPNEIVTVLGEIQKIQTYRTPRQRMMITEATIADKTGSLDLIWFNQPYLENTLKPGQKIYASGKIEFGAPHCSIKSPEYEIFKYQTTHTARLVPIYKVTKNLSPKWLRYLVKSAIPLSKKIPDYLPLQIKHKYRFLSLSDSLYAVHFPSTKEKMQKARERLSFDEFFILQTASLAIKKNREKKCAAKIPFDLKLIKKFIASLPFRLTDDQRKSAYEILKDLEKKTPMNRLLNGDVGSGKTVVAATALLSAAAAGFQAVLMAPTEILANQHYQEISKLLKGFKIKAGILTAARKIKTNAPLLIGTHALLQRKVKFKNLGLVVIDEQHRFGVRQRAALKNKTGKFTPHFLSLTATPIPRSLALTTYGDLDISQIRQMPPGRKKTITKIVPPEKRQAAYEFIRGRIKKGEQAFLVCPVIEKGDRLGVNAATTEYQKLKTFVFPEFKIGLLHGRQKTEEKVKAMADFKAGRTKILVATAVVEVGIDIPNATIMMIEGAERFGLASLHQFRGRVGRGQKGACCLVFTESTTPQTLERLNALLSSRDGFELAEYDLQFRGPGAVYGTEQSGFLNLKIGSLLDFDLIKKAREEAALILGEDPNLKKYPMFAEKVKEKMGKIDLE
ncbi:MAG: ATP-dependent DNA helicase RecG [bacterium]|nr:ATP-dependent DNA helicase RecG [bacterium]